MAMTADPIHSQYVASNHCCFNHVCPGRGECVLMVWRPPEGAQGTPGLVLRGVSDVLRGGSRLFGRCLPARGGAGTGSVV